MASDDRIKNDPELAALIGAAQTGSRDAFEQLARHQLAFLSQQAAKYVPPADIPDVVQESLIRLHAALPSYRESGKFQAWLRAIVVRASLDYWRTVRRHERTAKVYFTEGPTGGQGDLVLRHDLERCLNSMSPDDRLVCIMAFLEQCSHREIANLLGCSVVAVKVRCFRLRAKMRSWFES